MPNKRFMTGRKMLGFRSFVANSSQAFSRPISGHHVLGGVMRKSAGHNGFLLAFAPEQWDAVKKFGTFKYKPLQDDFYFKRGISTTSHHLEKFRVLAELGNDLLPGFNLDEKELDSNGYSPAKFSRKFAAVAECCINELYAALDGIKDVIFALYKDVQGVQKKSTSKLFTKAKSNDYGEGFPNEITELLTEAHDNWFFKLRKYRTEFTHGSLGSCSKDRDTNKISYMHVGLGESNTALRIEDFIEYTNATYKSCLLLQEKIFEFLYRTLPLEPTDVLCGFYTGLGYMRSIEAEEVLTVHSGVCKSAHYDTQCPIREKCGAYKRAKT
ncbi:hypothetical protein [Shewanella mangrovisoli]|uniref:hypothetical protein n=1 Tax=Shewanella mangrovisoli TaxID=2864211 RepID=UPI0035B93905